MNVRSIEPKLPSAAAAIIRTRPIARDCREQADQRTAMAYQTPLHRYAMRATAAIAFTPLIKKERASRDAVASPISAVPPGEQRVMPGEDNESLRYVTRH
jgi:hypothetical protein